MRIFYVHDSTSSFMTKCIERFPMSKGYGFTCFQKSDGTYYKVVRMVKKFLNSKIKLISYNQSIIYITRCALKVTWKGIDH